MPSFQIDAVDEVVRGSLIAFIEDFTRAEWWGKEHDCVNRFVHGFLMPQCSSASVLAHPTQIGIEVGVAQPRSLFARSAARKDVVIWPEPWMSCWNDRWEPVNYPMVVMEWKALRTAQPLKCHAHDREWLCGLSKEREDFVGYSVTMNRERGCAERLLVLRFFRGETDEDWLRL